MNSHRWLVAGLLGLILGTNVHAQQGTDRVFDHKGQGSVSGHFQFDATARPSVADLPALLATKFAAKSGDQFRFERVDKDALGMEHHRFQQFHAGYPVFGAVQKVHVQEGKVSAISGNFVPDLPPAKVNINEKDALAAAIQQSGAQKMIWQLPGQDAYLRNVTGKADASWIPQAQLFYAPNKFSSLPGSYRLAWKVEVYSVEPLFRADLYIDAETGKLNWRNEKLHSADAVGNAHTRFSGQRAIVADSTGSYYRLIESGRALGVETYDLQNQTDYMNAVEVTQLDNDWDTFPSPVKRAALDAHWGAEMTYDFFQNFFARDSYDDASSKLISYVSYDMNYSNAFWNGIFMTYGDGGGNNNPFSGLDVCGHEFNHGVTEYAAGLVYQDE
jgi:bacillolysin